MVTALLEAGADPLLLENVSDDDMDRCGSQITSLLSKVKPLQKRGR